jgi:hypothetical protein
MMVYKTQNCWVFFTLSIIQYSKNHWFCPIWGNMVMWWCGYCIGIGYTISCHAVWCCLLLVFYWHSYCETLWLCHGSWWVKVAVQQIPHMLHSDKCIKHAPDANSNLTHASISVCPLDLSLNPILLTSWSHWKDYRIPQAGIRPRFKLYNPLDATATLPLQRQLIKGSCSNIWIPKMSHLNSSVSTDTRLQAQFLAEARDKSVLRGIQTGSTANTAF